MEINPIRILFVEDNLFAQKVAGNILSRLNCTVDVVSTGIEALGFATRYHYDLILMDLELPGMDGLAVTEAIRKESTLNAKARIVALTAHEDNVHQNQATWVGMDAFLTKPLTYEKLQKILSRFVFKSNTPPVKKDDYLMG